MASWEAATALGTLGVALITGSVAYGRLRQRVVDMGKQVGINTRRLDNAESRLSDGDGELKVIGVKLDNLLSSQSDMKEQLGKMDDRLRKHCEDQAHG